MLAKMDCAPPEIILYIVKYLSCVETINIRLLCSHFRATIDDNFDVVSEKVFENENMIYDFLKSGPSHLIQKILINEQNIELFLDAAADSQNEAAMKHVLTTKECDWDLIFLYGANFSIRCWIEEALKSNKCKFDKIVSMACKLGLIDAIKFFEITGLELPDGNSQDFCAEAHPNTIEYYFNSGRSIDLMFTMYKLCIENADNIIKQILDSVKEEHKTMVYKIILWNASDEMFEHVLDSGFNDWDFCNTVIVQTKRHHLTKKLMTKRGKHCNVNEMYFVDISA